MGKPAERIAELSDEIRDHDRKYYVDAAPELTDREYDQLMDELKQLEADHPELVTPESPTQRVGEQPVEHLESVEHRVPMLSIDNTYSVEELRKYGDRIAKLLPDEPIEWVVELKIDGVAASVTYEHGVLTQAVTRGNGTVGDDITHNIRTVADLPLKLTGNDIPAVLEVRGEIYMTNSDLVRLNEQQIAQDESVYANTRNVTAGSIRLLDPRKCAQRRLKMFSHGVGYVEGMRAESHSEFLAQLAGFGLTPSPQVEAFPNFEAAIAHCETLIDGLHELDFEVDGLVLKVNRFKQRERLGSTSKSPRWLIAYKFEKYEATTRLNNIYVQIGKTGAVTPVADLEPVQLAGTTVSRASLHNADEIERKDVRVGDVVVVEKAGKIIPHIVRVEKHERKKTLRKFKFPTHCPECETELVRDEGGVYIRCPNDYCPASVKERIRYFASRNAMDIEGLGDKLVDQLVTAKLVRDYADLYRLEAEQVQGLERMGEKSSQKLIQGIDVSRERGLARLLNALSIRHVGRSVSAALAREFGEMDKLQVATVEELSAIDEIGDIIAQSVFDFCQSERGARLIEELAEAGVNMKADQATVVQEDGPLAGKNFVVTGTLTHYTRDTIRDRITQLGGRASSSVSKNTDYLVAGEKAGSKLTKAQSLGVAVLTEDEFRKLVGE